MIASMHEARRVKKWRLIACAAAMAVAVVVAPHAAPASHVDVARSGSIRGRVELRRAGAPVERRPNVADLGAPAVRDIPDLLRSVVYLESAPRGAFETAE